ncbi:MAG: N-acetyl-gamma-glutamyl-phosphate reductase, partial [Cellulomonadaceae bacterium]|nr:N-acetyl-gamma-glutamyl-phosphate reductase [Cellulomonadaceae bacterium]
MADDYAPQAHSKQYSVAVAGASGYAGGEFLRIAASHPHLRIGALTAHSSAGQRLGSIHPHLRSLADRILGDTSGDNLAGHDIVVLALPHGASGAIAAGLPDDVIVLDLGADHRLDDAAAWRAFYGTEHVGTWPYGLPELITGADSRQRDTLPGVHRIAVPGCNVTAVTLGIQPGIAAGIAEPTDIVAVLANGYSGAGKALKPHLLASEALGAASPYAVGGSHRHIPEIIQNLGGVSPHISRDSISISFTPTLVPMSRGILATTTARLAADVDPARAAATVRAVWESAYADEPFVHVVPQGQWPSTAMTLGSNSALVQVAVDVAARRI